MRFRCGRGEKTTWLPVKNAMVSKGWERTRSLELTNYSELIPRKPFFHAELGTVC